MNEFSEVTGYKISMHKCITFLHTNNLGNNPMYKCIKKYLSINLIKEVKDLYSENYRTLMKEIKDDPNRWKDIQCS